MAGVHHATTRCLGCGATLRVCAQGQAAEDEAPLGVYVVCPSCRADVAFELPAGVDVGTLQVVGFERRVANLPGPTRRKEDQP
jgi:hypothetical protein